VFDEIFPLLSTTDPSLALSFYRDLLGCRVVYRFPPEGEAEYVGLSLGSSRLDIVGEDRTGANDRITLWVYAENCDAAVARLRGAGVEVVEEPIDQPWGERMAVVADPDGNRVVVASRAPAG